MTSCDILATKVDALQNTGWGSLDTVIMSSGEWIIIMYILLHGNIIINRFLKLEIHAITSTGLCTNNTYNIIAKSHNFKLFFQS